MQSNQKQDDIRAAAQAYESALPSDQRKELGQFFTGQSLSKLLAHLAFNHDTKTVLDPMAGHGDLLHASWEVARERRIALNRLDGFEIHDLTASFCQDRLTEITQNSGTLYPNIMAADAFDPGSQRAVPTYGYDLVITNPPFVRYQTHGSEGQKRDKIRSGLNNIASSRLSGADKFVWETLIKSYSGLADLSIPSCILASLMLRPGGRLALVVPATWRSRDYSDVIRYLLLRCFALDYIVEDMSLSWFPDALVRTHLVVARRLTTDQIAIPIKDRLRFPSADWVQVTKDAANESSLVGNVFDGQASEMAFATWLHGKSEQPHRGIQRRSFDLRQEWVDLESRIRSKGWYQQLESAGQRRSRSRGSSPRFSLPEVVRDLIPSDVTNSLRTLGEDGIKVGQGLRTGCNRFFYLSVCGAEDDEAIRVQASSALGGHEFLVPAGALRPVLRRQSEIPELQHGNIPPGRVLDLRMWVLPEEAEVVKSNIAAYQAVGQELPQIMPDELAAFVRLAADHPQGNNDSVERIPDLSAVRTNIRLASTPNTTPSFWYMLPAFSPRHSPNAFIPRVIHTYPWAEANLDPPILIDANFSTIWSTGNAWTPSALKALFNSVWCRIFMEALGTPLGGGALKLEASHIRRIPIPRLPSPALKRLDAAGKELTANATDIQSSIDELILHAVLDQKGGEGRAVELAHIMAGRAYNLRVNRQIDPA